MQTQFSPASHHGALRHGTHCCCLDTRRKYANDGAARAQLPALSAAVAVAVTYNAAGCSGNNDSNSYKSNYTTATTVAVAYYVYDMSPWHDKANVVVMNLN